MGYVECTPPNHFPSFTLTDIASFVLVSCWIRLEMYTFMFRGSCDIIPSKEAQCHPKSLTALE